MTLTIELDLYTVNVTQQARHLGQRSSGSKAVVLTQTDRHTHTTDCYTRTTKVAVKYVVVEFLACIDWTAVHCKQQ